MTRQWWILVMSLLLASRSAMSVPSCGKVGNVLAPCLGYLMVKAKEYPSHRCCRGVNKLKSFAKTETDGVATCKCAKNVLSQFKYYPMRLPLLSKKCGVAINLPPIDKNFDCSKVSI